MTLLHMKLTCLGPEIFDNEYLANMKGTDELEFACNRAMESATDLQQMLQLRVEMTVLTLRLRELGTPPHGYSFLLHLIGDLQLKIATRKLSTKP